MTFRIGQCFLVLHRPAMHNFADSQLDDLAGLGTRNVGDLNNLGRDMAGRGSPEHFWMPGHRPRKG